MRGLIIAAIILFSGVASGDPARDLYRASLKHEDFTEAVQANVKCTREVNERLRVMLDGKVPYHTVCRLDRPAFVKAERAHRGTLHRLIVGLREEGSDLASDVQEIDEDMNPRNYRHEQVQPVQVYVLPNHFENPWR